jgi:hypothetical protein
MSWQDHGTCIARACARRAWSCHTLANENAWREHGQNLARKVLGICLSKGLSACVCVPARVTTINVPALVPPSCLKPGSQVHLSWPGVLASIVALVEWSNAHHSQNLESTMLTAGRVSVLRPVCARCQAILICATIETGR